MRIIILSQYYPPETGAPQARLSELAIRFIERGHQVFVLTAMPNYPRGRVYPGYHGLLLREEIDGIPIIRTYIYPTKSLRRVRRLSNYLSFVVSSLIVGGVALPRADYLITESPPLFLGVSGYILSHLKGARWIFNVSDLWPESAVRLGLVREGLGLRLARALEAFCYRKAWLVCGQSREILECIHRRYPQVPTYHLSNGVDTTLFVPGARSQSLREKLAEGKECIAIYAGLHGAAQGLDQVLDAAERLQDLHDLGIVFVGDGPEKERLVNRSREMRLMNVCFLDPYPREAMPVLLASADIALVPLKNRLPGAVPSKLYEAMGSGLPVVLVADGEAADIVRETQSGIAVSPGDSEALVLALCNLVKNKGRCRQLGAFGRQAAVRRFDRRTICNAFVTFLEERL